MNMRLFEYALEIYKTKSFTKAASNLHIAQPSLSKQISKLEQELGVRLFDRNPGAVEPTPNGICFVEQGEKILQMRNDLQREILERKEGISGELKIGSTAITGGRLLPPLFRIYTKLYPNVSIQLIEASTKELIDLTGRGLVDISILSLPIEDPRLNVQTILTEPLYLVLPKERKKWMPVDPRLLPNNLHHTSLTLKNLSNCPFILLKQGYGFRRTVFELFAREGFEPHIAYETSSIETAQSLAENGLGLTIVPEMAISNDATRQGLSYIQLDANSTRTLAFTYSKDRYLSMNAKAFMEIYQRNLKKKGQ